jgi:hypothetical protein
MEHALRKLFGFKPYLDALVWCDAKMLRLVTDSIRKAGISLWAINEIKTKVVILATALYVKAISIHIVFLCKTASG